jgi:hypothetical protein
MKLKIILRYANAGIAGTYYSENFQSFLAKSIWLFFFRVTLGLLGSLFVWTGVYNIIDAYTVEDSLYKDLVTLCIGLFGLAVTGTFYGKVFCHFLTLNIVRHVFRISSFKQCVRSPDA